MRTNLFGGGELFKSSRSKGSGLELWPSRRVFATQRWGPELGSLRPRKKLGIVLTTPDLWEAEARESLGFSGFHIPQSMAWSAYVLLPHSEGPATDLEMSVIHTSDEATLLVEVC